MIEKLREAANQYGDGLITDREFLSKVVMTVHDKWQNTSEMSNDDKEVAALALILRGE